MGRRQADALRVGGAAQELLQGGGGGEAEEGLVEDLEAEGEGFGGVLCGRVGGGLRGEEAGDEGAEVGDGEHLQDGLVAAGVVGVVVVGEEEEGALGVRPDDLVDEFGGEAVVVEEGAQELDDGVVVEDPGGAVSVGGDWG